jgi:hypothetical protein
MNTKPTIAIATILLVAVMSIWGRNTLLRKETAPTAVAVLASQPDPAYLATHPKEWAALKRKDGKDHTADVVAALISLRTKLEPPDYPRLLDYPAEAMVEASYEVNLPIKDGHPARDALSTFSMQLLFAAERLQKRAEGSRDFSQSEKEDFAKQIQKVKDQAGDLLAVIGK